MFLHVSRFWSGLILFWLNAIAQHGLHFSPVTVYFHASARWNSRQCLFSMCQDDTWPRRNSFSRTLGEFLDKASLAKSLTAKGVKTVHTIYLWLREVKVVLTRINLDSYWFSQLITSNSWVKHGVSLFIKSAVKVSPHETPPNQILLKAVRND